jgi:hypothetical protein
VVEPPDPSEVAAVVDAPAPVDAAVEVQYTEVPGGPLGPRTARRWATEQLSGRLGYEPLFNVQILISELVTNAVRHGRVSENDFIKVAMTLGNRLLRVEVRDRGGGFERPETPEARDDGGGNGFVLLHRLTSRWGVIPGDGALVWFELDLPAGEAV